MTTITVVATVATAVTTAMAMAPVITITAVIAAGVIADSQRNARNTFTPAAYLRPVSFQTTNCSIASRNPAGIATG